MGRKKSYNAKEFSLERSGVNEEYLSLFFKMIYDRQMIWKRRFIDKSPAPWTQNPIFLKYKFCNLYREHDRSSQWEIRNIIMDNSLEDKNLIWKMLVYRTFNNPETFARAMSKWPNGIPDYDSYDEDEFAAHIEEIKSLGLNPFMSAYSISGNIVRGVSITDAYCHTVIPGMHRAMEAIYTVIQMAAEPEQIISLFLSLPGASAFMAHEYYQDLTYITIYSDRDIMKFGQNDFTNLGPGSSQGAKLLFPELKTNEQLSCYTYLQSIAEERLEEIGLEEGELMPYTEWNKAEKKYDIISHSNLSLNQIEGALCEFSKYVRILENTGRPRCYEFVPRTSSIIVERSVDDQAEFFTTEDSAERRVSKKQRGENECATQSTGKRGRPSTKPAGPNISMDLNLNVNLLNAREFFENLLS